MPRYHFLQNTYFVKRFYSRHTTNPFKYPSLKVQYNDAIQDQTSNLFFDVSNSVFLYNYYRSSYENLISGSSQITGSNCLLLTLLPVTSTVTSSYFLTVSASTLHILPSTSLFPPKPSSKGSSLLQLLGDVCFTSYIG